MNELLDDIKATAHRNPVRVETLSGLGSLPDTGAHQSGVRRVRCVVQGIHALDRWVENEASF